MSLDAVVVGAGVVGLAIGRDLARRGLETVVLEGGESPGTATSARNSEVIHAGIHYPRKSLKATLCVRGRRLLLDWCAARKIPHRVLGKLIVATRAEEIPALEERLLLGQANGVDDLQLLSADQVRDLEPEVRCVAGLLSPGTGILDSHAFLRSILRDAQEHGAWLALKSPFEGARIRGDGFEVQVGGEEPTTLKTRRLINAAGIDAPAIARRIAGVPAENIPRQWLAKGDYFGLRGSAPFSRLVYPLPEPGGLGIHLTLDLADRARFGPDVEWISVPTLEPQPEKIPAFEASIRAWWPGLPDGALEPAYSGIRPKLSGPGETPADFCIQGPDDHGAQGLVQLFGIDSPGLTASLAIAERVSETLGLAD